MSRFVHREAEFQSFAEEHFDTIVAIPAGWMLEKVRYRVSFACDIFDNAIFRNWRTARVAWALWFGPSSAAQLTWSSDRQSTNYVHWQASPWIPDYETNQPDGSIPASPANSYRAGLFGLSVEIPVYRFATGAEHQLRHVDVDSDLSSFPAYSYCSETELYLWAP